MLTETRRPIGPKPSNDANQRTMNTKHNHERNANAECKYNADRYTLQYPLATKPNERAINISTGVWGGHILGNWEIGGETGDGNMPNLYILRWSYGFRGIRSCWNFRMESK